MTKHLFLQILLSLTAVLWTGSSEKNTVTVPAPPSEDGCGQENGAFLPGEEIVYKIYYNLSPLWIAAGEVIFRVDDAGKDYKLSARAYTYKSYEWFYRGHYTFESRVDKKSLMPNLFLRTIEEKKYSRYNKFVFDQNSHKVSAWQGKTAREAEYTEIPVSACMHDMMSIMYYVRNMNFNNLKVGQSVPIQVFLEEEYPLKMRVLAKNEEERIRGLGKQKTHVFSPEVIAGDIFNEDTQMKIWVSADQNKVPLLIESPVRVGKIKAVLQSYKGLRYDFVGDD
jgi:hypothetical protein